MKRPAVQPGDNRPVLPLNMEELRFWLTIMQEHALFIKAGLPADRKGLIEEAQEFYRCFGALLGKTEKVHGEKKFCELIDQVSAKTGEFYRFKRRLLQLALRGELGGCLFPSFLDHLAREAGYFLRLLDTMHDDRPFRLLTKPKETRFWVHLMADHSEFIRHLLDPSEVRLIDTAEGFVGEFNQLYVQSGDYVSMLRGTNADVPAFNRFLQDTRAAGVRLRDFKRALTIMLEERKALSIINPLLADHVRREADHFLLVAAMLDKNMQVSSYSSTEDILATIEADELEDAVEVAIPVQEEVLSISDETETVAQQGVVDGDLLEQLDDEPQQIPTAANAPKMKYRWSSWPKPLGEKEDGKE